MTIGSGLEDGKTEGTGGLTLLRAAPHADVALAAVLGATGAAASLAIFAGVGGSLTTGDAAINVWFQSDAPRVFENLTDRLSNHYRTSVHPASSILLMPIAAALMGLGLSAERAVSFMLAVASALTVMSVFTAIRLLGLPRIAAAGFGLLFLSSAGFLHWAGFPELNVFAGLSIALCLVALALGRRLGVVGWIAVSAGSLSITVTNWSVGLAATLVRWPFRKVVAISGTALVLVVVLALVQAATFRQANLFFLPRALKAEADWLQTSKGANAQGPGWSPVHNLRSLFVTTVVAPPPHEAVEEGGRLVSNQFPASTGGTVAVLASVGWLLLFVAGVWGALTSRRHRPIAAALAMMLGGQALLHLVYGSITFLYAPHVLPILIVTASFSWFTAARPAVLPIVLLVIAAAAWNNIGQLADAIAMVRALLTAPR